MTTLNTTPHNSMPIVGWSTSPCGQRIPVHVIYNQSPTPVPQPFGDGDDFWVFSPDRLPPEWQETGALSGSPESLPFAWDGVGQPPTACPLQRATTQRDLILAAWDRLDHGTRRELGQRVVDSMAVALGEDGWNRLYSCALRHAIHEGMTNDLDLWRIAVIVGWPVLLPDDLLKADSPQWARVMDALAA